MFYRAAYMRKRRIQRRAYPRIDIKLEAQFDCGAKTTSGIITNISENGLFINTKLLFPFDINFNLLIQAKDNILNVPVKISRLVRDQGNHEGLGVEVVSPPPMYLEYVNKLKASLNASD